MTIRRLGSLLLALWAVLEIAYFGKFIYHDLWRAGFPILFKIARESDCGSIAVWLGGVDTGAPVMLYLISFSLTHLFRFPTLYAISCLQLDIVPALFVTKAQVTLSYFAFAGSMLVLGRVLFEERLSALYLFIATLFAGLLLDTLHSDQVVAILFWTPWTLSCAVLASRKRGRAAGGWYLCAAVFFLCLGALDQYPHFPLLAGAIGGALAVALWPGRSWELLRRHWWRLIPAILVVLITALQLWVLKETVPAYRPGQNRELIVDPGAFDDTGLVQPTALIGSFFPLGFLAGFERLANNMAAVLSRFPAVAGRRWSIFRLDALLFFVGHIPLLLALVFVMQSGERRLRAWWIGTTTLIFLVSLRQSGIYLLLFRLPFFDVFRAYFLYIVYVVPLFLVMSAYGLDACLAASTEARRRLISRGLRTFTWIVLIVASGVLSLVMIRGTRGTLKATGGFFLIDMVLLGVAVLVVRAGASARDPHVWTVRLIMILAISQTVYFAGVYHIVGIGLPKVLAQYELDSDDRRPLSADAVRDPEVFRRKECTTFTECYASLRPTATVAPLVGEWRGAFWRSRDDPIFDDDVAGDVVEALSGVTHPVFWLSGSVSTYERRAELVEQFNANAERLTDYLRETVNVRHVDRNLLLGSVATGTHPGRLSNLRRLPDRFWLEWDAPAGGVLNAAITYDPDWVARVNGAPAPIVRGNFNGLAIQLPPGQGAVELVYRSPRSRFLFGSRIPLVLIGATIAALIGWRARDRAAY